MPQKSKSTPKIRRTRRHVVVRLTPDEAKALFLLSAKSTAELPPRMARSRHRCVDIMMNAAKAGEVMPPPAPNRTSIGRSRTIDESNVVDFEFVDAKVPTLKL